MSSVITSIQRSLRQPGFVVIVIVMGICAATMNAFVAFKAVHFKKLPVPLRVKSLREGIPAEFGDWHDKDPSGHDRLRHDRWVMVSTDHAIDPDIEHVLLTSEYIFRDYVDSRKVAREDIERLKSESTTESQRNAMLMELRKDKPSAVMRAAVTYYTGLIDTVAHVPERCFVADGFEISSSEEVKPANGTLPTYRFLSFEDQAAVGIEMQRIDRNVAYFFNCNGSYTSSSLEVRRRLQSLLEPYGYYAKIELMTAAPKVPGHERAIIAANDAGISKDAMEDFMAAALPELEKCLPDWAALHAKK